ncbi:MAG: hypothetical protein F4X35_03640, partial [Alphaproteobacteria bacterium]|nr:hypothetical protein [Alphaproteobacteria bacterium]
MVPLAGRGARHRHDALRPRPAGARLARHGGRAVRRGPWWAFLLHRLSGVALAVFLPFHFLVLGLAVERAALDGVLRWTDNPWVKLAEAGLVVLL